MNNYKNPFRLIIAVSFLLFSCTQDFTKLNTTPNEPTSTTIAPLVNGVYSSLLLGWHEQAAIHIDWLYPATQLAGESSLSGYLMADGVSDIWTNYYSALQNMNLVQDKINAVSDKESMNNVQAILNVMKAYKTFKVTDFFGDIPYSKAGKTYTGNPADYRPVYDTQQTIYSSLLTDLKWAVDNIKTSGTTSKGNAYVSLGSEETFFGNDLMMWKKFANSLMLRYAMQIVEKDPATATPFITYAISQNLFIDDGSDVGVWPATVGVDLADRPWSFGSGGTGFIRISSTMWNLVADGTDPSQIFDPRATIFAETNAAGQWAPYTIGSSTSDKVNPYDYSSSTPNKHLCIFSPFNFYLMRDEHYIPELMMTAAETHFLKAEAYLRGNIGVSQNTATANAEYVAGITASVNMWESIAANCNTTESPWAIAQPQNYSSSDLVPLLANPKVAFTGDNTANLKKIYAQEWLDNFRQPWLAFNLWRRTGLTPVDPAAVEDGSHATFYRLPYPQDEAVNNTVNYNAELATMGGTNSTSVKMWWMK